MCGVAGFWNFDGSPAEKAVVDGMLASIQHRGPDNQDSWLHGSLALGHARLSILDPTPRGHQPFMTDDQQGVIAYVGEVYNFRELRKELEQESIQFRTTTDTEVVLYALHQWGVEKTIPRLNGMFALAYFDRRTGTLWLACDRLGIRTLYVHRRNGLIVFGSEIKAVLAHAKVPCRPDMHVLTTQVIYGRVTGSWSPFEDIEAILPGTIHKISPAGISSSCYFDVLRDVDPMRIAKSMSDFGSLTDQFEQKLSASVKAHLVSDVPLAIMCSGGLDSGLTTAYASQYKSDLVAYVADVEGVRISEYDRARQVCEHIGVELRRVPIDQRLFMQLWPKAVYHNDEPNFYSQDVLKLAVCGAVRNDGFKVLITGEGADELFAGYNWHKAAWKRWKKLEWQKRLLPNNSLTRRLGRWFRWMAPPDMERLQREPLQQLGFYWPGGQPRGQVAAIDGGQRTLRLAELFAKLGPVDSMADRALLSISFEDIYTHLRTALSSSDKMAMAVSLESRVPFLENELIDFGLHLAPAAKYHNGVTKRVVKEAASRRLPKNLVHLPKVGFGPNMQAWMPTVAMLENGMLEHLFKWGAKEAPQIREQIARDRHLTFHMVTMEMWARIYLDHQSPDSLAESLLATV